MTVALFVDANQYLKIFGMVEGKKLLNSLDEQRDRIFVPAQIVDEVLRQKLNVAVLFLSKQLSDIGGVVTGVPDHLLGITENETKAFRKALQGAADARTKLAEKAAEVLAQISRSQDDVSIRLKPLFNRAQNANADELQRARCRREIGNPPGKINDPLGDQIVWEQLLSYCKTNGVTRLWIITGDGDYCVKHQSKSLLNPFLRRELVETCGESVEIRCFDDLLNGIKDFGEDEGVKAQKLPTKEEATKIRQEIDSLPSIVRQPVGLEWLTSSGSWYGSSENAVATGPGVLQLQLRQYPFHNVLESTYPSSSTFPVLNSAQSIKK
jgi:hypothetical protein